MGGFSGDRKMFSTVLGRISLGQGVAGELQWWKRVIFTHVSSCQRMLLLPGGFQMSACAKRCRMPEQGTEYHPSYLHSFTPGA
jgi:hypothetical protein